MYAMTRLASIVLLCLPLSSYSNSKVIFSGSLGYADAINQPNDSFAISNYVTDTLHHSNQQHYPSISASVKKAYTLDTNLLDSVSLGPAFYFQKMRFTGDVWELDSPEFNNYSYTLTSQHLNLLIEGDIVFKSLFQRISPFITLGAGVTVADVQYDDYAYAGIPANSELHLDSKRNTKAIVELGLGIATPIDCHWSATLNYLYQHIGDVKTASTPSLNLQEPIQVNLNNQSIYVGLNYSA